MAGVRGVRGSLDLPSDDSPSIPTSSWDSPRQVWPTLPRREDGGKTIEPLSKGATSTGGYTVASAADAEKEDDRHLLGRWGEI